MIENIIKYGMPVVWLVGGLVVSADALYLYLNNRKKRALQHSVNEVSFVMSDSLPCCKHSEIKRIVQNCVNPHCKAKLSHKIVKHIDSAKHLICVAM